ncbi:MAG: hypothetical protein JWR38_2273 [Mucilaginibacter sp.]|nr:hypothetical protein [Mucilaginibacter sp.]
MKPDEVRVLLDRYYHAETTITEEKTLKEYFAQHDLPDFEDQDLFKVISEFKNISHEVVSFTGTSQTSSQKKAWIKMLPRVAAVLVLGSLITVLSVSYIRHEQANRELELQQKSEADLLALSKILNDGYNDMNKSVEHMVEYKPTKN